MMWDVVQRRALQAMGLSLHALRDHPVDDGSATPVTPLAADALRVALCRAAGIADAAALSQVGEWQALCGNPAGKRALWPRLRALRRMTS